MEHEMKERDDLPLSHQHCWHPTAGPTMILLKDGHVAYTCCECGGMRTKHRDHGVPR